RNSSSYTKVRIQWTGSRRESILVAKRRVMSTKIGRRKFLGIGAAAAGLGLWADLEAYPQNVNRNSIASDLKITDMRIAVLRGPGGKPIQEGNGGPSSAGGSGGVGLDGPMR